MTGKELLPLIVAPNGRGDRLSENLWRWVRKHSRLPLFVAYSPVSCIDGKDLGPFDPNKTLAHQLYVGFGDLDQNFLHGSRLSEILCEGARAKTWAFPPKQRFQTVADWWKNYIKGGKCFIDPEHRLYGPERWLINGKTRTCSWCGEWHEIQRKRKVTKTVTTWVKMEEV